MRKRENTFTLFIILLVVVISIVSGTFVFVTKDQYASQAITTVTAVVGVFAIWFQMRKSKRLNEGEFIVNLNNQFVENKNISELFLKMEKYERTDKSKNVFYEDDITKVAAYMTFFEVIFSLIERKIIKLWMIDDLFSYQFFLLLNNDRIQKLELIPCEKYYINVYKFYKMWKDYRKKHGLEILNEDNCILSKISVKLSAK